MTHKTGLRSAVCIAAMFAAGAAQADVTAAQVWEDWKDSLSYYGEENISFGSEETSGDTLTVSGLTITHSEDDVEFEMNIGDIAFTELGDGTVAVTLAESFPITLTFEEDATVKLSVVQTGMDIAVSGDADELNYVFSADTYGVKLDEINADGETFEADVRVTGNDISGDYTTTSGDLRTTKSGMNLSSLDILADIKDPDNSGEYLTFSGKIDGMSMQSAVAAPKGVRFDQPDLMTIEGLSFDAGYTIDSANYVFDFNGDGDAAAGSLSNGSTKFDFSMDNAGMAYDVQSNDLAINITGSEIPFPVEIGMAQYGVGFKMPLSKTEEAADFGLNLNLTDLTVNDLLWSIFDPGAVLPRDPATLQVDLAGKAKLLFDILDPAQAGAIASSDMPAELDSLKLNNLKLALAGAMVKGAGDFTFDNSDLVTFGGVPRPEGSVEFQIDGLNGLMDNLIAMGLLPEEQAGMGRLMLGMFARTTGEDQLSSTLEINADGHVLANGQRIQ